MLNLQPFKRFDTNKSSGDGEYLEHLLGFLEVLERILINGNETTQSKKT